MSLVMLVTLKAHPGSFEQLKKSIRAILPDTVAFSGCLGVSACADEQDRSVTLYERWATPEAQQSYLAWRGETGDLDGLGTVLREPPSFEPKEGLFP